MKKLMMMAVVLAPLAVHGSVCAAESSVELRWQDYDQPGYRSSMQRSSAVAEYALTTRLQRLMADDKTPNAQVESYLERLISITTFQNKYDAALQYCDHALRLAQKEKMGNGALARLHANRGYVYLKQGKLTQAEMEYDTAARLAENEAQIADIKKSLAAVYTEQKRFAAAEEIYKRTVRADLGGKDYQLADVIERRPEPSGKYATLDETQNDRRDLVAFAKCLFGEGKLDESAQKLLAAIELDRRNAADVEPTLAAEFNDLACVYAKQGNLKDADRCMEIALQICKARKFTDLPDWVANQKAIAQALGKAPL